VAFKLNQLPIQLGRSPIQGIVANVGLTTLEELNVDGAVADIKIPRHMLGVPLQQKAKHCK
jgi:hypothetical protein